MKKPLVSILIPVYNAQATIIDCINSCLNQTHKHIEIIVCNDGSIDDTLSLLNSFENQIKIISNEQNSGIAFSRNRLLNEASGEYIAWIDADDCMLEQRIETQVNFMLKHQDIDICGTGIVLSKSNQIKLQVQDSIFIKEKLWFNNCIYQPSIMSKNFYKNELIYYSSEFDYMEDYELWNRLKNGKKFYNLNVALTVYNMPSEIELKYKHNKFLFEEKWNKIWELKWKEIGLETLNENEKLLFQNFMRKNSKKSNEEIYLIIKTLNRLTNKDNHLIIQYHYLRLWVKNCNVIQKFRFLKLIGSFIYLPELKAKYLL